jgi:hypothetical protein
MKETEIWIFGYGSLIFDPEYKGKKLSDYCDPPIDGTVEEGVEFLHTSKSRGRAPTLCFDGTKRLTRGKCWRAVGESNIKSARGYLRRREGEIKSDIKVILSDGRTVPAYCGNTFPDLKGKSPVEIAKQAVKSEQAAPQGRGGITYIKRCEEIGLTTPMMAEILAEIYKLTRGEK